MTLAHPGMIGCNQRPALDLVEMRVGGPPFALAPGWLVPEAWTFSKKKPAPACTPERALRKDPEGFIEDFDYLCKPVDRTATRRFLSCQRKKLAPSIFRAKITAPMNESCTSPDVPSVLSERLQIWVTGIPKGQPRPKAFSRAGHAGVYDPGTANDWKSSVAKAFEAHHGRSLNQPLMVEIGLFIPRPKAHFTTKGALTKSAPSYHLGKPDLDNAEKAIMDILTDVQFWKDDSIVIKLTGTKDWTTTKPGAWITITPVP